LFYLPGTTFNESIVNGKNLISLHKKCTFR